MNQPDLEGETGRADDWCLLIGPGPRLAGVAGMLTPGSDVRAPAVVGLVDVAELLTAPRGLGRLLIDAEQLDPEDVGILRRWMAASPHRQLILFGNASQSARFPSLAQHPQAFWTSWPGWIESLGALARPDSDTGSVLNQLEAPGDAFPGASDTLRPGSRGGRHRVAELANLTQRLELSLARLSEEQRLDATQMAGCYADLERLAAFAHSLQGEARSELDPVPAVRRSSDASEFPGESAPRLPRAAQAVTAGAEPAASFDLASLVAEKLEALHLRSSGATRYELDGPETVLVNAERSAVSGALETFLRLGQRCLGAGDRILVRMSARPEAETPHVDVALAWPAGPLANLSRSELLGPGQVEALLPDVSSADLRRAVERVEVSGGLVDLRTDERGLLRVTVRTTLACTPQSS